MKLQKKIEKTRNECINLESSDLITPNGQIQKVLTKSPKRRSLFLPVIIILNQDPQHLNGWRMVKKIKIKSEYIYSKNSLNTRRQTTCLTVHLVWLISFSNKSPSFFGFCFINCRGFHPTRIMFKNINAEMKI